jgi:peptidyl-prolyl cis-trans isomerase A (cyclophilin A)
MAMRRIAILAMSAAASMALVSCSSSDDKKKAESPAASTVKETVPEVFHVKLDTSKGMVDIEVHRDWAPVGADHFFQLVKSGFYDGARFFRVVRGFVVQFGINGDPQTNAMWANATLPDDPVKEHNVTGTVTFATRGRNTRSTQLFINLADNRKSLDGQGFAPIGKVVDGMPAVLDLYGFYGDMPPMGQGPDPQRIQQQGNDYIESHFPRLDFIKKATVQ